MPGDSKYVGKGTILHQQCYDCEQEERTTITIRGFILSTNAYTSSLKRKNDSSAIFDVI